MSTLKLKQLVCPDCESILNVRVSQTLKNPNRSFFSHEKKFAEFNQGCQYFTWEEEIPEEEKPVLIMQVYEKLKNESDKKLKDLKDKQILVSPRSKFENVLKYICHTGFTSAADIVRIAHLNKYCVLILLSPYDHLSPEIQKMWKDIANRIKYTLQQLCGFDLSIIYNFVRKIDPIVLAKLFNIDINDINEKADVISLARNLGFAELSETAIDAYAGDTKSKLYTGDTKSNLYTGDVEDKESLLLVNAVDYTTLRNCHFPKHDIAERICREIYDLTIVEQDHKVVNCRDCYVNKIYDKNYLAVLICHTHNNYKGCINKRYPRVKTKDGKYFKLEGIALDLWYELYYLIDHCISTTLPEPHGVEQVKVDVKDVKVNVKDVKVNVKDIKDVQDTKISVKDTKVNVKDVQDAKVDVEDTKINVEDVKVSVKDDIKLNKLTIFHYDLFQEENRRRKTFEWYCGENMIDLRDNEDTGDKSNDKDGNDKSNSNKNGNDKYFKYLKFKL